ncbi:hypothetical protein [Vibrio hangzhouensis]|uniref:Uncharacterized protein n=1 Tax=Vibrio hangzhouensis TaxID=462991 RepID=A0A1H5RPF9_9VIBR|nr:hypothetical protein [Vibrio hangzhouensis]MBY6196445.1 hypothetical protein [Vibrio hangzhouensis]SEF39371.1 hypothetical protein SAMN04488244_10114 [Vibrio hangzhouensis]
MSIKDSIEAIEQQIYVACSEGDYETVNMLEHQLERLRGLSNKGLEEDPYALEHRTYYEDEW